MTGAAVEVRGLRKTYGEAAILRGLNLTIEPGAYTVVLGPSGSGKTTLLAVLGGFTEADSGQVLIDGVDVTAWTPARRPTTTVFQDYALFPHMSVADNVGFGLAMRRVRGRQRADRVAQALALVGLADFGRRSIASLSGGQRQRVALARALVVEPAVLLLDEPLGALDLALRRAMQEELAQIQRTLGTTFVHVTHDQEEAMTMADTVAVMNAGRIEQMGHPADIYETPRTVFVANFLGQSNLIVGLRAGASGDQVLVQAHGLTLAVPSERCFASGDGITVGVRPEKITILDAVDAGRIPDGHNRLEGRVTDVSYTGVSTQYLVEAPWGQELIVFEQNVIVGDRCAVGDPVVLHWSPSHTFGLDPGAGVTAGLDPEVVEVARVSAAADGSGA